MRSMLIAEAITSSMRAASPKTAMATARLDGGHVVDDVDARACRGRACRSRISLSNFRRTRGAKHPLTDAAKICACKRGHSPRSRPASHTMQLARTRVLLRLQRNAPATPTTRASTSGAHAARSAHRTSAELRLGEARVRRRGTCSEERSAASTGKERGHRRRPATGLRTLAVSRAQGPGCGLDPRAADRAVAGSARIEAES
jgi:hypothetical protein